jgi:hypothetical protein
MRVRSPADAIVAADDPSIGLADVTPDTPPADNFGDGGLTASGSDATGTTADPDLGLDPGPGLDITVDPLFSGTREIRTGRRAALRRPRGGPRRVRTLTVILLVVAVLGAPLGFYALREAARDPVFGDLAALDVPDWAARDVRDEAVGSRWCIGQCRLRQRIMRSERTPEETAAVYRAALSKAGWVTWAVEGCNTTDQDGIDSCWQRDEYVLDLWVYQPECEVQLKAPDPAPSASGGAGTAPQAEAVCPPTVVALKVINRVGYEDKAGGRG